MSFDDLEYSDYDDELDLTLDIIFFTCIILMPVFLSCFICCIYSFSSRFVKDSDYDILPDYNEITSNEDYDLPTYDENLPSYDEAVALSIENVTNYNSIND